MKTQQFAITGTRSNIDWVGRKVTGAHNGTIAIKEGSLVFNDGRLTGGRFVIDTASIKILDITDPAANEQFAAHLASDDFFGTASFPESVFAITVAEPREDGTYHISGDLTIKDITHPISFDAQVNLTGNTVTATGKITVDRTRYGIRFRSGNFFTNLGDTLIYNNFDLHVSLTAQAVAATALA
jgi:polyisoprenoid-binding protein YceI